MMIPFLRNALYTLATVPILAFANVSVDSVPALVAAARDLFDFDVASDGGNLISAFKPEPCLFHNNLVNHSGRGVMWMMDGRSSQR